MWLDSVIIWILVVVTPGGQTSQMGIYSDRQACEQSALSLEVQLPLRAECRMHTRSRYGG